MSACLASLASVEKDEKADIAFQYACPIVVFAVFPMRVCNLSRKTRRVVWCDERHATCDVRATFDASAFEVLSGATGDTRHATSGRHSTLRRSTCWLVRRATRDMRRAGDVRRFEVRRVVWCDERHAICDERATFDASTRDEKNRRATKTTFCQNTASTTYSWGKERL